VIKKGVLTLFGIVSMIGWNIHLKKMPVFVIDVGCLVVALVVQQDQNLCLYPKVSGTGNMQQAHLAHCHVMLTAIHIRRL